LAREYYAPRAPGVLLETIFKNPRRRSIFTATIRPSRRIPYRGRCFFPRPFRGLDHEENGAPALPVANRQALADDAFHGVAPLQEVRRRRWRSALSRPLVVRDGLRRAGPPPAARGRLGAVSTAPLHSAREASRGKPAADEPRNRRNTRKRKRKTDKTNDGGIHRFCRFHRFGTQICANR